MENVIATYADARRVTIFCKADPTKVNFSDLDNSCNGLSCIFWSAVNVQTGQTFRFAPYTVALVTTIFHFAAEIDFCGDLFMFFVFFLK